MVMRAFCLWPQHTRDTAASRIAAMYERWRDDWGLVGDSQLTPARVPQKDDLPDQTMHWQTAVSVGGGKCWFGCNSGLAAALGEDMYGTAGQVPPGLGSIVGEAGAACMAAFTEQLWAGLQARPADAVLPPDDEVWQPGSGALMLLITLGDGAGCLVLSRDVVLQLCPMMMASELPAPCPVQVSAVLAEQRVSLQVSPGTVCLSLAEVCSLEVGDVIALDKPLDQPLELLASAGTRVCGARLLRDGEHKVVSVTL